MRCARQPGTLFRELNQFVARGVNASSGRLRPGDGCTVTRFYVDGEYVPPGETCSFMSGNYIFTVSATGALEVDKGLVDDVLAQPSRPGPFLRAPRDLRSSGRPWTAHAPHAVRSDSAGGGTVGSTAPA